MNLDELNSKSFLEELHRQTKGNMESQVSMYEVGASIGLAKGEAGSLAEGLMVAGLVELRTLSGGISITCEGLTALGISPVPVITSSDSEQRFSNGPVADKTDCELLCRLVDTIKSNLSGLKMEYQQLEEIIIDLKTIEVQLLSPSPKIAVFRELLRSLHHSFQKIGYQVMTAKLAPLLG
jgi:hypothetical protein